jgi:hypothetical protein
MDSEKRVGSFESLEARTVLAGNVTVLLEGELLRVTGDVASNAFEIVQSPLGDLTFTGQEGTTINNLPSLTLLQPGVTAVDLRTEGGSDRVIISNLTIGNDLNVVLGTQEDNLTLNNSFIGGNLLVDGGEGTDSVVLNDSTIGIDFQAQLGSQLDGVNINGGLIQSNVFVDGGEGSDVVAGTNATINGDITTILGSENDNVSFNGTVGGSASFQGDDGNDTINVTGSSIALDLLIDLGNGVNSATVDGTTVNNAINVIGGTTADTVSILNSSALGQISVDSKEGNDAVTLTNSGAFLVNLSLGLGTNQATVANLTTSEDLAVNSSDGADTVSVSNSNIGKSALISLAGGADRLTLTSVAAAVDAIFEGGSGVDTLDNNGVTVGAVLEIKEFEVFI